MDSPRKNRLAVLMFAVALLHAGRLAAQTDYQWQVTTSGGLWSTPGNWSPSGPANGSGNTADFGTLTLPANNTVHLDAAETIGAVIFGDQGNGYSCTLDNNGSGTNVLTLAVASGTPAITVNDNAATISAVLGGTSGLAVYGSGQVYGVSAPYYPFGTGNFFAISNGGPNLTLRPSAVGDVQRRLDRR